MKNKLTFSQQARGFSLLEMAIVLIILGFVLGAILAPIQAQRQQLAQSQTENTLEIAKRALLGFAQQNGRLPCPATNNGTGILPDGTAISNPNGSGACERQLGFLPAATLGMQITDQEGYAVDAWNNKIMYAVAQNSASSTPVTPDFTTSNATDGMSVVGLANLTPELRVCNSAAGITAIACSTTSPEANYLINNAVAVIYSLGPTGAQASGGADEDANPKTPTTPKTVFVGHEPRASVGNEFDHMVIWISPYVLYNAMIEAGQLH